MKPVLLRFVVASLSASFLVVAAAGIASAAAPSQSQVLIDGSVGGVQVYWTEQNQLNQDARQSAILHHMWPTLYPASTSSLSVLPMLPIGTAPSSAEITVTPYDGYPVVDFTTSTTATGITPVAESATGILCGPIAAHNLLTHFEPSVTAASVQTLETPVGYVSGSGTPFSAQYATGINEYDGGLYSYNAYLEGPTWNQGITEGAWNNAFGIAADSIGLGGIPTSWLASGWLPGFNHNLASGHWFVGYGYSGYSATSQIPSIETLSYLDTSMEHSTRYWFSETVETFLSPQLDPSSPCYVAGVIG